METIHTQSFANDTARYLLQRMREAVDAHGLCRIGLSGGNTPRKVYAALAEIGADFPWQNVQFTFGDERCVPPDHEMSNFRMASESLLCKVPVPAGNVFRMRGEDAPEQAAEIYEGQLAAVAERMGETRYRHDILLLGVGGDGHTASLFPGTTALEEATRNVVANFVPQQNNSWRITLTFPIINAAREVCFLVESQEKEAVIREIQTKTGGYPSERVAPADGTLVWILGW
jgi:6-phosphogluconolactonase